MANAGKEFEKDFKNSVPEDVYYMRINDNALGFNIQQSQQRFTTKSPYDALMYRCPCFFALELKSTQGKSISFGGKQPMIKEHQIKELAKASKHNGIKAGFVFNFRECDNKTVFVPIVEFIKIARSNGKKSININELNESNSVVISNTLKKVRYKYDIEKFMLDALKF